MDNKNVTVIGSGEVGRALARGFVLEGYKTRIVTRDTEKPELKDLVSDVSGLEVINIKEGIGSASIVVVASKWSATEEVISGIGADSFANRVVVDVTNPLGDMTGSGPALAVGFPNSAGKLLQDWLPKAHVVKAFNMITSTKMYKPSQAEGLPTMVIAGNSVDAKATVTGVLREFGWVSVIDVGGIENAYIPEALAMGWIYHGFKTGTWSHAWSLLGS